MQYSIEQFSKPRTTADSAIEGRLKMDVSSRRKKRKILKDIIKKKYGK